MSVPNSVIPDALQGVYFDDPILPIPQQETGLFDLVGPGSYTPTGAGQSGNSIADKLNEFAAAPTSMETLSAPRFFDYEGTQADRYKQSKYFSSIGFDPTIGTENEYRYGARQTWGDVWTNGLSGMFSLAGNTYVEGWKGWGHLADAIRSQDMSKLVGTEDQLMEQDKATKDILNKYAIFSTPESEEGIFNRKFFGDMLQQSGFAVGTIAQFLSEELLTYGLSTEFSLSKLGLKVPAWAGKVVSHADVAEDLAKLGNPIWKAKSFSEGIVQAAREFIPLADTAYTMSKYGRAGAGALQIASIGVGGARRFLSEANMAMTEARMEAAGTFGELYNKLYDEELRKTGQAPVGETLENIKRSAMDAASDNFNVNAGILMLSNRLQFNNLFSRFGVGRAFFGIAGEFADDVLKVSGKRAVSEAGEQTMKAYTKGKLGTFGLLGEISRDFGKRTAAWEATKSVGRNLFKWETSEGIQELLQEGSNKGLSDYYYDLYHGSKGYDSKMDAIVNSIDNPLTNIQGAKTFLMGALTGRLLSPINFAVGQAKYYTGTNSEQRATRKANIEEAVSMVNAFYENPNLFLNEHIANVKVQNRAAQNMEEAIRNRDQYEFVNNKDGSFAKMMSAAIKTDMHKAVISTIREYGDAFSDEEFKQAFGMDRTEENIASVKEYFNRIADETESFHKTWKQLKDKFGDMVMEDLYKEGTPEAKIAKRAKRALDDAIEILATNNYRATRNAERANKLYTDMASIPNIGASVASAFRNLGVIQNSEKEIEILENELKSLDAQEKKDKATKDLIKTKKAQLKSLRDWTTNHEALKGMGVKQKRKFGKAVKAFESYVKSKNLESGIDQEVKLDDIQDIYEKLIDYIELNKDSKDYIDAYNILSNPIKFVQTHQRLLDAMDDAANRLNQEHVEEVIKAMTNKTATPAEEGKDEKVPDFQKYMEDAYESMKAAGSTDLTFEEWVNSKAGQTFTNLYNKKYNKNESLGQEAKDLKAALETIKKDVEGAPTLTVQIMDDVFNRLSVALGVSVQDVENAYYAFQETLDKEEVKKALIDMGAKEGMPAEEVATMISKHILPKFIDKLISTNGLPKPGAKVVDPKDNLDVIELPSKKIKMTKPKINTGESLVDNGKEGIFIVRDAKGAYFLVDSDGNDPLGRANLVGQVTKEDALTARDEMIKERTERDKKDRSFYVFDGKEIRAGLVLTDNKTGKEYVVATKGEPFFEKNDTEKKNPLVKLTLLRNRQRTNSHLTVNSLNDFTIKQKEEALESGEVIDQDMFRLLRTNELSRIYPHINRSANESEEAAQERLDNLLKTVDPKDLAAGISIRISQNPADNTLTRVSGGRKTNPNLVQAKEKYQIQILFNGTPIGYLTNYTNLQYQDETGLIIPIQNLTLDQFRRIFDSQGKDPMKQMQDFKANYNSSRAVFAALSKFVKPGQTVEISPEEVAKIIKFNVGIGEFDFVANGVPFSQLPYQTIDGHYYIIDRSKRYGKGFTFQTTEIPITDATGQARKDIEKQIAQVRAVRDTTTQMGRYLAVIKLPNGRIRFIELATDPMTDDQLNDLITKINQRSAETKEKNVEIGENEKKEKIYVRKKIDFNEELNSEIADKLFISVPQQGVGTYIDFALNDTGNLELTFHKKVGDKDIRRQIYVYGKTLADPANFSSIDDMISQINAAIEKHDKDYARNEAQKIGFKLTKENFKASIPDAISISQITNNEIKFRTGVSDKIVMNVPLSVSAVQQAPLPTPPQTVTGSQPAPASKKKELTEAEKEAIRNQIAGIKPTGIEAKPVVQQPELDKAKNELDSLLRDKELEVIKRRDEKIGQGLRPAKAMMEANDEAASMFDSRIKAAKQKINDAKNAGRNTALKITSKPEFTAGSVVNIDEFKKYISRILGDKVSVQEMEIISNRLKKENITVGRFMTYLEQLQDGSKSVKGRIEVGADTGFKYHEAFHAVFRLMLSDSQIDRLLAYAKIEVAKKGINVKAEMQKMRELHTIYAEMSEKELEERFYEEYMADQFEEYKSNPTESKTVPGIRGYFQKLWDFIKNLFSRIGSRNELKNLFQEIERGKFRNAKVKENRFTKPDALSINEPVLKAIKVGEVDVLDENGMYITIPKYLSQQEGDQLASTVASMYHTRVLNIKGTYNKKKLLEDIFADFMDLYDIDGSRNEFYMNEMDNLYEQNPDLAKEYHDRLKQKYEIFSNTENRKTLAEAVDVHLNIMGYQQELEDDEYVSLEDEFGSRVSTDNWKETHSIGGFGSLSKFLRQYIAATTFTVDKDEFGNTEFVNGEPLMQAVNANLVYNGVLKAVANITDQKQFVQRLQELHDNNTETGKFLNKFFEDTMLEVDPQTGEFTVNNPVQATLFQSVIKGFQQYTVDYIFINKDIRKGKKMSALMLANRMGEAKTQFTQWQNAYVQIFEAEMNKLGSVAEKKEFSKERTEALTDLVTLMDPGRYISDEDLYLESQRISNQLKTDLGISLSPLYIKFSIASVKNPDIRTEDQRKFAESYSDVEGATVESLRQIIKSIQALENPFAKNLDSLREEEMMIPGEEETDNDLVDDLGEGGNISRINELAKGNAIFDETVSTTSYKNAEGELVYAHQLPTFHLVKVNELKQAGVLESLLQDDFLSGNILLESNEFRHILDDLKVERIEGMKSSILNETEDGKLIEDKTITSNQNKGITYGSFSDRELIVSLLEMYKYNKEIRGEKGTFLTSQHLIRVIEASNTGDTVSLPVIKAVETDKDGNTKLSKEAVGMLAKEVAREFARIQKVRTEIRTNIFEDGEIKGYHYAVDDNGNRTNKKTPRGLKFYKMANMLGKQLAAELEEAAKDPNYDITQKAAEINARIQEYWGEKMEEFVDKLDNLGVITISKDENNNETIINNLVDDFITSGITVKGEVDGKKKEIADEKTNEKLNLIPNNVRHNLGQILVNDYLNTLAFNQLLYGDEAKAFKDEIDQVKRAKGANGSGPSLESIILAPELGITEQFTKSHILTFTDPKYKAKYAGGLKDKADAQSYTTVKGMRYTLFGLGRLNPQRAAILDKIERGEKLTSDEIFGDNGLVEMEGMFNSQKLVYFDGPMYIKTSTVMLTKELTSMQVDGRWVARPGYEELHDLRERMEKYEAENETVTFAAPETASKGIKRNIFDSKTGFSNATDDDFVQQDTKYWRLQLENPSNKLSITDPTQAKQIIIAEQDDNTMVNFMGSNVSIGTLKKLYLQDTEQRVKNNYFRARNDIFDIEKGFEELGKSIRQDKITAKLAKFQERALETLRSSGADSQLLEFFSLDEETGQPKYNLNSTLTLEKYTQLFLAYFSKGVMSEKSPGHSVALMSNYGVKVVKVFTGRYDEDGVPIGKVVPRAVVEANPKKYMNAKRWDNDIDRNFTGLKEGDIYIDDLRHNVPEYDKNGKIIGRYAEFMMPPHFKEDLNLKPGDPIPDWIAKMFGVRIPSQDKHSFISLRLVDFMPAYYGSTAVFPHELIEISGADFDIDKLYMHIADTYVKGGRRVAYGSAKTAEGKFEEFVRWNTKNNRSFREELNKLKETDPNYQTVLKKVADLKRLEKDLDNAFDNIQESDGSIRQGFATALASSRMVDSVRQTLAGVPELNQFSDQYGLVEDTYFMRDMEDMINALDEKEKRDFFLTMGTQWFEEFKELNRSMRDVETRLISQALRSVGLPSNQVDLAASKVELNNGVLNNRILDQKLAMLNNDHITKGGNKAIGFEVASVKALSDLLDSSVQGNLLDLLSTGVDAEGNKTYPEGLEEILLEGGSDTDSMLGKYKAFKNNKEGSRNIGPAVNAMLVYAIMNNFKVNLRDTFTDKAGNKVKMFKFKLNGHEFSGYGNTKSYNSATGKYDSNERVFNMISTLVSAMTDNAKERLAARLGLNIEAVGYVSNMVAQGVPLKSAVMMMLQPVVREYFEQTKIASNNIKTNAESQIFKSQIAKELLAKYTERAGEDYVKEDLTDDILIENIKNNGSSATFQASVMQDFMGIMDQSRYYSAVAGILKLTKGLGTSFEEYDAINEKIEMLGLRVKDNAAFEKYIDPINGFPPPFDLRQVFMGYDENKDSHSFIKGYIQIADQISEISKGMFLERTSVFRRIQDIVKANLKVRPSLRERFETELKKDLISYLSIKAYRKFLADNGRTGTLSTMTNALIYDEAAIAKGEDFFDIVDIMRAIRAKLPENYLANQFLNVISTSISDYQGNVALNPKNRDGINKLESNTWAKLSEYQVEKLRDAFVDIYQSDEDFDGKGRNGRDMANALFNYLIVKDGAQFRSGSFIRYIPNFIFTDFLESTGKANDILKLTVNADNVEELDEKYKQVFGVNSLELFNEFMVNYVTHVGNAYYVEKKAINNEKKYEPTGRKAVDEFEPASLVETEKGISIDIFRGTRDKQVNTADLSLEEQAGITFMSDEDYLQFLSEMTEEEREEELKSQVKSKKFNDDERGRFKKNMQSLRDKGFFTNESGQVEFPYIIKVGAGERFKSDQYYILKSVRKAKGSQPKNFDPKRILQKGELVAQGVAAFYEPVERKGSPKTFKGAAMFDPIPATGTLRKYRASLSNSGDYHPSYPAKKLTPEQEELWMVNHGFPVAAKPVKPAQAVANTSTQKVETGNRTPKQILLEEYGITMQIVAGKGINFGGDTFEDLKEALGPEAASKLLTPSDVLRALNYTPSAAAPQVTQPTEGSAENMNTEGGKMDPEQIKKMIESKTVFGTAQKVNPNVDPEEIKRRIAAMSGNNNNPLNDECAGG